MGFAAPSLYFSSSVYLGDGGGGGGGDVAIKFLLICMGGWVGGIEASL